MALATTWARWSKSLNRTWKSALPILALLFVFSLLSSNIASAQALQAVDTLQTTSDSAMTVDAGSGAVLAGEPGGSSATVSAASSANASLVAEPGSLPDPKAAAQAKPVPQNVKDEHRGWKFWQWFRR
jgi:hypothetical protein